jgi:single-strand DNA-binding protein
MVNIVCIGGNLCFSPELKYTSAGMAVCNLRLANNSKYTTKTGEKRERVVFVDVIAWGKTAEACAEYLDKGSKILVEGELTLNEWEDRKTGQKHSRMQVRASQIHFLSTSSKKSNGHPAPAGAIADHDTNDANEDVPF